MNAFERFEAKVEKPNAFERFEKANAPKLNAFERSAFDDGDPVYDPMAAVGLAWGQYEDLQQRYPSLLSGEIAQIAADAKYKGKVGFGEEMRGLTLKEFIPGAELADLSELYSAVNRLGDYDYAGKPEQILSGFAGGDPIYLERTYDKEADIKNIESYMLAMEKAMLETELRGSSWDGKLAAGLAESLPFMVEFLLTRGASLGVRKVITESAERMAEKFGKKLAVKKAIGLTGKLVGTITGAGVQATIQPSMYEDTIRDIIPHVVVKNGELHVLQEGMGMAESLLENWAEATVENFSEESGRTLMKGLGMVGSKIPGGKKLVEGITKLYQKTHPDANKAQAVSKMFDAIGIQGFPEEWLEERFGGFLREVLGLPGGGIMPNSLEDALVEMGVLAVPTIGRAAASRVGIKPMTPEREIENLERGRMLIRDNDKLSEDEKDMIYADIDKQIIEIDKFIPKEELDPYEGLEEPELDTSNMGPPIQSTVSMAVSPPTYTSQMASVSMALPDPERLPDIDQQIDGLQSQRFDVTENRQMDEGEKQGHYDEIDAQVVMLEQMRGELSPAPGIINPTITGSMPEGGLAVPQQANVQLPQDKVKDPLRQRNLEPFQPKENPGSPVPIRRIEPDPELGADKKESDFKVPTIAGLLTSDITYAQVLGLKEGTEPGELGKQEFDLEYRNTAMQINKIIRHLHKQSKTKFWDRRRYRKKGVPTNAMIKIAEALNNNETAPEHFTPAEHETFDFFRTLSKNLWSRENAVRNELDMPAIPYRKNYYRHVASKTAEQIENGEVQLPEQLKSWMADHITDKIYNPMEKQRALASQLEKLYSRDLAAVSKSMTYIALREIHLNEPIQHFKDYLESVKDVIPASTRKWAEKYWNERIMAHPTELDNMMNELIAKSGFGKALKKTLKPFGVTLSDRAFTNFMKQIGRANITWAIWGRPKLLIRNLWQRLNSLGFVSVKNAMKSELPMNEQMKGIMESSLFWRGYVGIEEIGEAAYTKIEKWGMAGYQLTASSNAKVAMKAAYWQAYDLITKKKYRNLKMEGGVTPAWADPQRTYNEPKGFLYESEMKAALKEMETVSGAGQFQYIPLAMPGIFRHKALIPVTRLQSWWMNYFFKFLREMLGRGITGRTSGGRALPWSMRLGALRYVMIAGPILTHLGYEASFLMGVLPRGMSPIAKAVMSLYTWIASDDERESERARKDFEKGIFTIIPTGLAAKEFSEVMSGEKPPETLFLYGVKSEDNNGPETWWEEDK